jgi:very-long-chain (3R)-3-hydroxyacyl-CoA dehydratase
MSSSTAVDDAPASSLTPSSSPSSPTSTHPAARRTSLKTKYLLTYNSVSALLWLNILLRVLSYSSPPAPAALYATTGTFARWTQTLALLEIAHALSGLVRAGVATTALQVASRVTLIWWIVELYQGPQGGERAYVSMLGAWSLTEVVRYAYFVAMLLGEVPGVLVWLRYARIFLCLG